MMKHVGTCITFLVLPVMLFAILYFGIRLTAPLVEVDPEPAEGSISTPDAPSSTCGNDICEKNERETKSCHEDC